MKLQFDKGGRRFFFLTFAVRGRRPVLSRIVEKPGRDGSPGWGVELLPPGEAVAALWRGIHARWPFLTASNFVIMPDHVHLLLIADYAQAPTFDVLDWFQHFRRDGEVAVAESETRKDSPISRVAEETLVGSERVAVDAGVDGVIESADGLHAA